MQVSHVQYHVTHAVIGGAAAIDFGISNSAEFFHILSSTLYKDQKLAVVRETLCNAWDAHIAANCQDKPFELTITNEKFVIRDYGLGIHNDDIGPVYGVYGNSTKKHDGKQTGGFGLGCKAPFAYTDHFEVQSSHAGVRTIYNMSKSSAEVGGKPSIKPIASFPTEEQGLMVTMRIAGHDAHEFRRLAKMIIRNGEMNAKLNDEAVDVIPFSAAKHDFVVAQTDLNSGARLMVRYGNVIYPIEQHADYKPAYEKIVQFLDSLSQSRSYSGYAREPFRIVFKAPPHSISVQPSREGLSMQSHTVMTLQKLMLYFLTKLDVEFQNEVELLAKDCITRTVTNKKFGALLVREPTLPGSVIPVLGTNQIVVDVPSLAKHYLAKQYPSTEGFRQWDLTLRMREMAKAGFNRGLLDSWLKMYTDPENIQNRSRSSSTNVSRWFQRHVISPLTRGFNAENEMTTDRLLTLDHSLLGSRLRQVDRWSYEKPEKQSLLALDAKALDAEAYLPYLRNIVVLSYVRKDVHDKFVRYINNDVDNKLGLDGMGTERGYLTYVVPRNSDKTKKAREYFATRHGVTLIDMTVAPPWQTIEEFEAEDKPVQLATPKKPKKKGLTALNNGFNADRSVYDLSWCKDTGTKEITDFKFITKLRPKGNEDDSTHKTHLPGWYKKGTNAIMRLFGDRGGIVINDLQIKAYKEKGIKVLDEYVEELVCLEIETNPRIQAWLPMSPERLLEGQSKYDQQKSQEFLKIILNSTDLCLALGLPNQLTLEDRLYLHIWHELVAKQAYPGSKSAEVAKVIANIKALPTNPKAIELYEQIKDSALIRMMDEDMVKPLLRSTVTPSNKARLANLREMLLLALKG